MAKKTLGYTELHWTCPNCTATNPGPEKTCTQCGAPQPDDVEFEQVTGAELIKDKKVEARVKAGPDIHCPYCGARNPGNVKTCSQCGGDLIEGERREHGRVLGAYKKEEAQFIPCPNCGADNLETAKLCSQCGASLYKEKIEKETTESLPTSLGQPEKRGVPVILTIILTAIVIGVAALIFLSIRTKTVTGTVERVGWERSIEIEGLVPIEYRDWQDNIPIDGEILDCQEEIRTIEEEPQPNSQEVCGTPYSIDTGSGYAEVVQDCEYHVYDNLCTYTVLDWAVIETISQEGSNFYPEWPETVLSSEQRQGEQNEVYLVYFDTASGELRYSLTDFQLFQEFQLGTVWDLEINTFGGIQSVSR